MAPLLSEHESLRIMSSVQHWIRLYFVEGAILSLRALRVTYTAFVLKTLTVLKTQQGNTMQSIDCNDSDPDREL